MPANARKQERLEARISPEQKQVLVRAAELAGQTLTEFVISHAVDAARRVVRENDVFEWTARDQRAFAEALTQPPAPARALVEGARWYAEQVGDDEHAAR